MQRFGGRPLAFRYKLKISALFKGVTKMKHNLLGKITGMINSKLMIVYFLIVIFALLMFIYNPVLGIIQLGIIILVILCQTVFTSEKNRKLSDFIEDVYLSSDSITKNFIVNSNFPLVILTEKNQMIWGNDKFCDILGKRIISTEKITDVVPDFPKLTYEKGRKELNFTCRLNDREYNVVGSVENFQEEKSKKWALLYWVDITQYAQLEEKYENERLAYASIVIDNYEESISGLIGSDIAQLTAKIDNLIFQWAKNISGYIKKLEKDRYILLIQEKYLKEYKKNNRFEILESVKNIDMDLSIPVTLSIGIGVSDENPMTADEYSKAALDMCLGRGGDQVVIKDKDGFSYYGGNTKETEKRTKVRARVISFAFRELIESKKNVIVIGHKNPDPDLLGAALGIYRAVRTLNKNCYIVLDTINPSIHNMKERIDSDDEYNDTFISKYQAEMMMNSDAVLVILDTHKKSVVSFPELVDMAESIVLIDHHRKSADFITNTVLCYHEPYASSTSELIIEMLQYIDDKVKLTKVECDSLYAGILVDTKNFAFKTGVRTFEAASFLRRAGLDPIAAKEMVKCDLDTYLIRSSMVRNAKIYRDQIAISASSGSELEDLTIIAQAADDLINIKGITTTFVLYHYNHITKISARSVGDVNVQVIMEQLGGGGHQLAAGTEVSGKTLEEVTAELEKAIDHYLENNNT